MLLKIQPHEQCFFDIKFRFSGDTAGRYNNLYGGTPNNGQIPNTMRTMEQKHYAGNSAFLNSGTFDLQNQVNMKGV